MNEESLLRMCEDQELATLAAAAEHSTHQENPLDRICRMAIKQCTDPLIQDWFENLLNGDSHSTTDAEQRYSQRLVEITRRRRMVEEEQKQQQQQKQTEERQQRTARKEKSMTHEMTLLQQKLQEKFYGHAARDSQATDGS